MKFKFKEGDRAIVDDRNSCHNGKKVTVVDSTHFPGVNVYWVRLLENSMVEFSVSEDDLKSV